MLQQLEAAGFTGVGDVFAAGHAADEGAPNGPLGHTRGEARAEDVAKAPMGPSTSTKSGVAHV
jgi:hypothetical protein